MIPRDAVPRLAAGCRLSEDPRQPELLLVPEGAIRLRGAGLEIVKRIDGSRTLAEIVADLDQHHRGSGRDRIEQETAAFLDRLYERGIVRLQ